jgi:tetratricopeptide (TPR) repeat protein
MRSPRRWGAAAGSVDFDGTMTAATDLALAEQAAEAVTTAEELAERQLHEAALQVLTEVGSRGVESPRLLFRRLLVESWALTALGRVEQATALLERARAQTRAPEFTDVDRAEVHYRLGCCRLADAEYTSAAALLTLALELCDRAVPTSDRLRARIHERRARCHRLSRNWEEARADVDRAIELAEALGDVHTAAHAYFQASIVAERETQWLVARFHAEHALRLYEQVDDRVSSGKVLNNLGGIVFLLGDASESRRLLDRAHRLALEGGSRTDAAYAASSLAQVELRSGVPREAEQQARRALELLKGRRDHRLEWARTQLVLARALLDQDRAAEAEDEVDRAETAFRRIGSVSHMAEAVLLRGDCAQRLGELERAARLYREAAELLRDTHF